MSVCRACLISELRREFGSFFENPYDQHIGVLGKSKADSGGCRERLDGIDELEVVVRSIQRAPNAIEVSALCSAAFMFQLVDQLIQQRTDSVSRNCRPEHAHPLLLNVEDSSPDHSEIVDRKVDVRWKPHIFHMEDHAMSVLLDLLRKMWSFEVA